MSDEAATNDGSSIESNQVQSAGVTVEASSGVDSSGVAVEALLCGGESCSGADDCSGDSMSANIDTTTVEVEESEINSEEAERAAAWAQRMKTVGPFNGDNDDEQFDNQDDRDMVAESDDVESAGENGMYKEDIRNHCITKVDQSTQNLAGEFGQNEQEVGNGEESLGVSGELSPVDAVPDRSVVTEANNTVTIYFDTSGDESQDDYSEDDPEVVEKTDEHVTIKIRRPGQGVYTQERSAGQEEELARSTTRGSEACREGIVAEWDDKTAEWRQVRLFLNKLADHLPERVFDSDLIDSYVEKLEAKFEGQIPPEVIRHRLKAHMLDSVELPSEMVEIDEETGRKTTYPIPLDKGNWDVPAALKRGADELGASALVEEELKRELPSTFEYVNAEYQNTCDVRGEVINIFDPDSYNQKQVFKIKDDENNFGKVTIWNKADAGKHGIDTLGMGAIDYSDNTDVPVVSKGDTIEIIGGNVDEYKGNPSIAISQWSMVKVVEEGDGEAIVSSLQGEKGAMQNFGDSGSISPSPVDFEDFDELDTGRVPLPRIRPKEVTDARMGEYAKVNETGIGNGAFFYNYTHEERYKGTKFSDRIEVAFAGSYNHNHDDFEAMPNTMPVSADDELTFTKTELPNSLPISSNTSVHTHAEMLGAFRAENEVDTSTELSCPMQDDLPTDTVELRPDAEGDGKVCPNCGSPHISSSQKQMGSSDEGPTGFNVCNECDNRWRTGY